MKLEELLKKKREILDIARRHGAKNIRVFGSVARGDASRGSDVDILVDLEPGRSLFDLGGLHADLEELLGCRVDVVTEKSLSVRHRSRILHEAKAIESVKLRGSSLMTCESNTKRYLGKR